MANSDSKELKLKEKQEVSSPAEQTKTGRVFTPHVDIFETEKDITLLADMPGVDSDKLTIDLRENTLTLAGEISISEDENEELIYREYETGQYYRQFSLSEVIDQERIEAKLTDGVLRLTLPKAEKAQPRQITVQAG